ncbi:MAG: hypothetical protein AB7V13_13040 [Pseudorhodoplanes sp.]
MNARTRRIRFVAIAAMHFVRNVWLAIVERGTGRPPQPRSSLGQFFRYHMIELVGFRPAQAVTCAGLPSEGAGSQALMIMCAMSFARFSGFRYLHTPFEEISHADRSMVKWARAWEDHFNLGAGETAFDQRRHQAIQYSSYDPAAPGWRGDNFSATLMDETFHAMLPEFKRKYRANKPRVSRDYVLVAVHVRRGDVSAEKHNHLFTHDHCIAQTVSQVKSVMAKLGNRFRILLFSEGAAESFAEFAKLGTELHLNVDPMRTMEQMIDADVLIMAKGCFSYVAGLLSEGVKLHVGYYVPPREWVVLAEDGSFDTGTFEKQLATVLRRQLLSPRV